MAGLSKSRIMSSLQCLKRKSQDTHILEHEKSWVSSLYYIESGIKHGA